MNMSNKKNNFIKVGFFILIFSFLLLLLDIINLPTKLGFNLKVLNFEIWGIYATFLGSGLTLYGVILTINSQYEAQLEDTKRIVKPMLDISASEYDYRHKNIDFSFPKDFPHLPRKDNVDTPSITISLENVGNRELYNLCLGNFESLTFNENGHYYKLSPILYPHHKETLNFCFYEKIGYLNEFNREDKFDLFTSPIKFTAYFQDCLDTWYSQEFQIGIFNQIQKNKSDEETSLEVNIERTNVVSAPKEISNNSLPWGDKQDIWVYYF